MSYNSKYSGEQVENLLDQVASGNTSGGGSTPDMSQYITEDELDTKPYVKYVAQTLTDEQKNQVRENLGIPSVDYIISLFEELKTLINNNSASDAIAVLDKAILDMHKLQ